MKIMKANFLTFMTFTIQVWCHHARRGVVSVVGVAEVSK
jgi:hypothetical protein